MKKLTILVDMDDTIEHLLDAWVDCLNEQHGTTVKCKDIVEWDLCKVFPGLTREQIFAPLSELGFWKTVKPMDGAADTLKWMIDCGHSVYIVTASYYTTVAPKVKECLLVHFPFISWDQVIVTSHKQLVRGDVLFDDAPHNLEGGSYFKVLVNAPHNMSYDAEKNGMTRMESWVEARGIVESLAGNS